MTEYSEQQLMAALRKADAAGDEAAARAIAGRIKSMRTAAPAKTVEELTPGISTNPAEGRNNFGAGAGKSLRDTGLAIVREAARGGPVMRPLVNAAAAVGIPVPQNPVGRWADERMAENAQADAMLMDTKSGFVGNVAGLAAQLIGPGAALKMASTVPRFSAASPALSAASRAFLPTSVGGNAIQGGVVGSLQPSANPQEHGANMLMGTAGGAVGGALPRVLGAAVRGVNRIREPLTERGIENIAGRTLQRFAERPGLTLLRDPILGEAPTLAEATLDPGIAQLQRAAHTKDSKIASALYKARVAANEARLAALQPFAGTPAQREAAMEAIEKAESAAYGSLEGVGGVDVTPVVAKLDAILAGPQGKRDAVRNALTKLRGQFFDGETPESAVPRLVVARQSIADQLSGLGDNAAGPLAKRELLSIRDALDDAIKKVTPSYESALNARRVGMRPVNEMDTVTELIQKATQPIATPEGGMARGIMPSAFLRPTEDLDALARAGTGFKKARADNVLSPDAQTAIEGIRMGLARQKFADEAAKAAGSPTAQFLAGQNVMDAVLGQPKGITSGVANMLAAALDKPYAFVGVPQRLDAVMARVLTSPAEAQRILARLPPPDRVMIEQAIGRLSAPAGAAAGAGQSR